METPEENQEGMITQNSTCIPTLNYIDVIKVFFFFITNTEPKTTFTYKSYNFFFKN